MRLIDAERLIAECKEVIAQEWNHKAAPVSWAHAYESFVDSLETAPAVDAVEVVRCKDCVHCRMSYDPKRKISDQVCGFVGYNPIQSSCVTDDFFCPYGERRSE